MMLSDASDADAPALSFSPSVFDSASFDTSAFVADVRQRVSLDTLERDLAAHQAELQAALLALVHRDYADFVQLSSSLAGLDDRVASLRMKIMDVGERLGGVRELVGAELDGARRQLAERRACAAELRGLEQLLELSALVEKVEQGLRSLNLLKGGGSGGRGPSSDDDDDDDGDDYDDDEDDDDDDDDDDDYDNDDDEVDTKARGRRGEEGGEEKQTTSKGTLRNGQTDGACATALWEADGLYQLPGLAAAVNGGASRQQQQQQQHRYPHQQYQQPSGSSSSTRYLSAAAEAAAAAAASPVRRLPAEEEAEELERLAFQLCRLAYLCGLGEGGGSSGGGAAASSSSSSSAAAAAATVAETAFSQSPLAQALIPR
eukprot:g3527.t1